MEIAAGIIYYEKENLVVMRVLNLNLDVEEDHLLAMLQVKPSIMDQIREAQIKDAYLKKMREKEGMGANTQFCN